MRNIKKTIDRAKKQITEKEDLTVGEIQEFYERYSEEGRTADALFNLIIGCFMFGYGIGTKKKGA